MRLPKFLYRTKRIKKKTVLLVLVVLILLIPGLLVVKKTSAHWRAGLLRDYPALTKFLPAYWDLRKLTDLVYLPYYFYNDPLPSYQLEIDPADIKKLEDSLPDEFMNVYYDDKIYVLGKFIYDDKTYDVEVRYRGDRAIHWNAPKKSYLIKFDKDEPFNGVTRLSFIIPRDRYFALEHFNNYRAKKLGLLVPDSHFGSLEINNRNNGLYFIIENWSQEMLAKWEVPDESNFYGNEVLTSNSSIVRSDGLWDNLDHWEKSVDDSRFTYDHFTELYQLISLLNNSDDQLFYNSIFNLVDKDNFYAWQIHQELINADHQIVDNIRLYFNNSSGKFYFIPWDVESGIAGSDHLELYSRLAQRIFSSPQYLFEKNNKLFNYLSDDKNLADDLAFYDQTYKDFRTALYRDRLKIYTNRWANGVVKEYRQKIIDAFEKLKVEYQAASAFVDFFVVDDDQDKFLGNDVLAFFDISVQSLADLQLRALDIELTGENYGPGSYQLYFDRNRNEQLDNADLSISDFGQALLFTSRILNESTNKFESELTKHRFYITGRNVSSQEFSNQLTDVKISLTNVLSGQTIKKSDVNLKIINASAFKNFSDIYNIDKFQQANPNFLVNRSSKEIYLYSGIYNIDKTIIIPAGFTLIISPATTLRFGPGISLVSYGPIVAQGTTASPINFIAQNGNAPWGVVAVINAEAPSSIYYARFFDGRDDYINGVYFSGMLSVYHSDLEVKNSEFYNAHADDGLNIKSARGQVSDSLFANNSFDAIDFDFVKQGEISNSRFINNGNDGIDISGSTIMIVDNYIEGSGDKCISIGERSIDTIVYNNVLRQCEVGVEIKDLSDIKIINNVIVQNSIGLNAYEKKPVFGGGLAKVYNSIIWDNETDIAVDKESKIEVSYSDIASLDSQNNNFNLEPVFNNPTNHDFTIRPGVDTILFNENGDAGVLNEVLGLENAKPIVGLYK